jgi:hypothetical protein
MAVLYVVAAGLGLSAALFHFIRYRAISALCNLSHETMADHIRINQLLNGGPEGPLVASTSTP